MPLAPPAATKRAKKPAVSRPPPAPAPQPQPAAAAAFIDRPISLDRMSVDSLASEALVRPSVFPVPRPKPAATVSAATAGMTGSSQDSGVDTVTFEHPAKPPPAAKRGKKPTATSRAPRTTGAGKGRKPATAAAVVDTSVEDEPPVRPAGRGRKAPAVIDTSIEDEPPRPAAAVGRGRKAPVALDTSIEDQTPRPAAATGRGRKAPARAPAPAAAADTTEEDWEPAVVRRAAPANRRPPRRRPLRVRGRG